MGGPGWQPWLIDLLYTHIFFFALKTLRLSVFTPGLLMWHHISAGTRVAAVPLPRASQIWVPQDEAGRGVCQVAEMATAPAAQKG